MRLFRSTYRTRSGKAAKTSKWYVEFRDHNEDIRRLAAFSSKAASDEFGRNIERLVAYHRASGGQIEPSLEQWLVNLPKNVRHRLVEIGLLDSTRVAMNKPLSEHLEDYAKSLQAKGNTQKHVEHTKNRITRVFEGCKFRYWSDLSASKVQSFLNRLKQDDGAEDIKGISHQTFNYYLGSLKSFCRWMVKERRATSLPLSHLAPLNTQLDRRLVRRAITPDELQRLFNAAQHGETLFGRDREGIITWRLSGTDRTMLYRLAVETGLRAGEIRSLTPNSFELGSDVPTVTVLAVHSKHRRNDTLPIRPATAAALNEYLMERELDKPLFTFPRRQEMASILRHDMAAAGIKDPDEAGRVVDFHALRHTFITNLAAGGVHPKIAQTLARHSTITLTMDRYSHAETAAVAKALEVLPDFEQPDKSANGVEEIPQAAEPDADVSAFCLAQNDRLPDSARDSVRRNRHNPRHRRQPAKHGRNGESSMAPEGFEPSPRFDPSTDFKSAASASSATGPNGS
jgi:integrase/recombinase XerD